MKPAMGLYSVLVLTRGAGEQGYIALGLACTPHWCSLGEPGNGLVLGTGANKGSLRTRLAQGLYSVLVLSRETWE